MNDETPAADSVCPECGAKVDASARRCGLCLAELVGDKPSVVRSVETQAAVSPVHSSLSPTPAAKKADSQTQFSLATMLACVTLVAVCLGLMRFSVPLGLGLLILSTPALIRSASRAKLKRCQGEKIPWGEKAVIFLGSLGMVTAACVAGGVACFSICWVGIFAAVGIGTLVGASDYDTLIPGFFIGAFLGVAVGLPLIILILRKTWPGREKREKVRVEISETV